MRKLKFIVLALFATLLFSCSEAVEEKKPNVVYILMDDMGYGDAGCYGQEHFKTPNIDKMATDGMRFTQHYSGSTVCAPSRSSLLTGQHTGHTPIRGNKEIKPEGQAPMPASAVTIAEVLKGAGYTTGAFGKWGLGMADSEGSPNAQGFDEFYGYLCQRMAHRYYPTHVWHNDEKVMMQGNDWKNTVTYAQDLVQNATLDFIKTNKDKPFFAYVPILLPHAELLVPEDELMAMYDGQFEETPYVGKDGADYGEDLLIYKYASQPKPKATFAAMMTRADRYVGEIMKTLQDLGIAENTIVMFASDNGPHQEGGADPDFFNSNGGLRGYKRDLYEGGIRSPFLAVWPGKIAPGTTSDHISAFWDVMPTVADAAGVEMTNQTDGISFLPTLLGQEGQKEHEYLYWEFHEKGGRLAVRMGNWKGIIYNVSKKVPNDFELYDVAKDPAETNNVAKEHPEVEAKIREIMKNARTESDMFKFKASTLSGM